MALRGGASKRAFTVASETHNSEGDYFVPQALAQALTIALPIPPICEDFRPSHEPDEGFRVYLFGSFLKFGSE